MKEGSEGRKKGAISRKKLRKQGRKGGYQERIRRKGEKGGKEERYQGRN
jgi:hypothetical protein